MKNITVSVDDDVHRRARIRAAERDTSVSAVVREFLNRWSGEATARTILDRDDLVLSAQVLSEFYR